MTEIASLSAAWSIPPRAAGAETSAPPRFPAARASGDAAASGRAAPADFPKESKVKTEQSAPYAFTYTFYDAKTLEIIGQWPQAPSYKLAPQTVPAGATLETIA